MEYPLQNPSATKNGAGSKSATRGFDMRDYLTPRRLTMVMWDYAFITRHMKGDSFEDYDRVLDELIERGYNTVRIDPMPQIIDLSDPGKIITSPGHPDSPFTPWDRVEKFEGPAGEWLIEFMEKLNKRGLYYCLSAWNAGFDNAVYGKSLPELTEQWKVMLREWKKRFGFKNCIYVDLSNEFPYFLGSYLNTSIAHYNGRWSKEWNDYVRKDVNSCLWSIRDEFPEVRFTVSLHGDTKWIDLDLELDVMDIHFYADADPRFTARTQFDKHCSEFFKSDALYKDFSDRATKTHGIMAPMLRAGQRNKLGAFASWSESAGIPLVTTESWASWFYIDHKDLDWEWLLEWAEWSVEDAVEFGMWGWTPHNYCQPQFETWKDVKWHRRLTEKFLRS
ncbi:MAG: cellulase-like family protein [Firmicutes bacterium]|nr:cellulase-like family protein [Bacillota bacterium]